MCELGIMDNFDCDRRKVHASTGVTTGVIDGADYRAEGSSVSAHNSRVISATDETIVHT